MKKSLLVLSLLVIKIAYAQSDDIPVEDGTALENELEGQRDPEQ